MKRLRLAIVTAAIPLVALAGAANAQDRYPPSPTESPDDIGVLPNEQTRSPAPEISVLPDENVNPPAGGGQVAGAPDAPAAPAAGDSLAATGADVALLGLSGAAALAAGGGAVYAARRRRD